MADKSAIEWTDATWTPIRARNKATGKVGWHCEHVSEGCRVCYAGGINKRLGTGLDFKPGHRADIEVFLDEKMLLAPLSWKRPRMIFVCSMTDLFAEFVTDEMLDKMFAVAALCPQHTFQVLTKRMVRARKYMLAWPLGMARFHHWAIEAQKIDPTLPSGMPDGWVWKLQARLPLPNVWLGISCEDQPNADARIPDLLSTPAAVRFVSAEPLLGPIDFTQIDDGEAHREVPREEWGIVDDEDSPPGLWWDTLTGERTIMHGGATGEWSRTDASLDWVIVGGESGLGARDCRVEWGDSIQEQCAAAGVACFRKQLGSRPIVSDLTGWRAPSTLLPDSSGYLLKLKSSKGGDAEEWPKHMHIREFPRAAA
jgi:protein gp37